MGKKVLFYNKKGGQGKTTWAIGYSLYSESMYITNDIDNGTELVYGDLFADGQYREFKMQSENDAIPSPKGNINVVYDFGGYSNKSIEQVIQAVDIAVIVVYYQSKADLVPMFNVIKEFTKHCDEIVILINNTDKKRTNILKSHLSASYPEIKTFEIVSSEYVRRLADEGSPISKLLEGGGVAKYQIERVLKPQVLSFYDHLADLNTSKAKPQVALETV